MSESNTGPSGSTKPRPLLALLLMFGVIILFQMLMPKPEPPDEKPEQGQEQPADHDVAGNDRTEPKPPRETEPVETVPTVERPERPVETADLIAGENLRVALSSLGVDSVTLAKFKDRQDLDNDLVFLPKLGDRSSPLSLKIDSLFTGGTRFDALPDLSREPWELTAVDANTVRLRNEIDETGTTGDGTGLEVILEARTPIEPGEHQYHVDVTVTLRNRGPADREVLYTLYGPGGVSSEATRGAGTDLTVVYGLTSGVGTPTADWQLVSGIDEKSREWSRSGDDRAWPCYVGLMNNYFVALLAPVGPGLSPGQVDRVSAGRFVDPGHFDQLAAEMFPGRDPTGLTPKEREAVAADVHDTAQIALRKSVSLAPGAEATHDYLFYVGPRDNAILGAYTALALEEVNDYGWFTKIVRLFMWVLQSFHWLTGNWGLSIVCLTLIVRSCLHPINRKQQLGMSKYQKKMQKIQPLVKEVQKKYEKDRVKMHQEMQKLFKEHNISHTQMMGGCLMIFLQLPIWIGLIRTLDYSIDLRQAPFFGWIRDLSEPDHAYGPLPFEIPFLGDYVNVLPILYVVLMIVQQKLQPKPTDPQAQQTQRMMSFMMIAFGFIFYTFPSGLMVYFITSAIFGLCESRLVKRIIAREEAAAAGGGGGGTSKPSGGGDTGPGGGKSGPPADPGDGKSGPPSTGPIYSSSKIGPRRKPTKAERQKAKGQPRY